MSVWMRGLFVCVSVAGMTVFTAYTCNAEEALRMVRQALRQALYANRSIVTEADAQRALMKLLEEFAPPNNLSFQVRLCDLIARARTQHIHVAQRIHLVFYT